MATPITKKQKSKLIAELLVSDAPNCAIVSSTESGRNKCEYPVQYAKASLLRSLFELDDPHRRNGFHKCF